METIITIIIGIVALAFLIIALFFNKRNEEIIENIKRRGHFVVEENDKGEQNVYFISENGEKTKYVPAYEEPSTTTLPPNLKEWINEEPLPSPPYKPLSTEEKIRNLESEIIRIWDYIMKIR